MKSKNALTAALTRCLLSVVVSRAALTSLTSFSAWESTTARYRSSLEGKCWYRTGLLTPAWIAISSIPAEWYPRSTKISLAASSNCNLRALRGKRVLRPAPAGEFVAVDMI